MDAPSETSGTGSRSIRYSPLSSIVAHGHLQLHIRPRRRDVLANEATPQNEQFIALRKGDLASRGER